MISIMIYYSLCTSAAWQLNKKTAKVLIPSAVWQSANYYLVQTHDFASPPCDGFALSRLKNNDFAIIHLFIKIRKYFYEISRN
jgi:hypothetical protein